MYVYPWDILDEGIEESLEYIKEIGMDKILLN